ncbi:Uncharacterised protein [Yersinia intermedia]|uniref:hypothetical protein n=1 Tax=Yersinia intermedia TaxID=631 RepID=UPI0005E142F6|nr:hypothetical protein [Yersinia intermedia]CQJ56199.1 Uncharacterised protein [Yersinia intermedia]
MAIERGWCGKAEFASSEALTQLHWADGAPAGAIVRGSPTAKADNEIIVHWDAKGKSLTLQHTTGSRKSLYYAADEQRIVFSTRLPQLLNMRGPANTRFDRRCLADLIVVGFITAPRTPYQGIYQLAPGTQIVWRYGSSQLECADSGCAAVQSAIIGVSFSGRAGNIPAQPQLSDNVMMMNTIPQLAALSGEAHGDPGLLRLLLRLARRRSDLCHVRLDSDLDPEMLRVATRFNQPWIRRVAQKELQQYWYEVRQPEIAEWFSPPQTVSDGEWIKHLMVCERQRVIHQIAATYQQTAEYYHNPQDDEEELNAGLNNEDFSRCSPEAGNLFCRAVQLKISTAFIDKFINLSPARLFRRDEIKSDNALNSLICAITSLNYLERFHHRLPR